MNISAERTEFLRTAVEIADPERRIAASKAFARMLGGDELIMFIRDPVIGLSLPAPGFPQTLSGMRFWKELVDRAIEKGASQGSVPVGKGEVTASAVGSSDGTVAVLVGGTEVSQAHPMLSMLLPFFGAFFRVEAVAKQAQMESRMARESAAQSARLASKLDRARTDLQRALEIAENATRTRDEFLAIVSHELRTPLTSIIGWVQLLREERDWASIQEGLETVERNARLQSRLIEDILDFSRINSGKLRLDVAPTSLINVIHSAIEIVRPAADAKRVQLTVSLGENVGLVSGDSERLQQIVWNLLANAVKFTPAGGTVRVQLERMDSHCELTVSDDGEGISPAFLPHVFDRFSQADSSSRRVHAGLGLGLAIVSHLVGLHGGSVNASSEGVGKGAHFVVRLPVQSVQHRAADDFAPGALPSPARLREQRKNELDGVCVLIAGCDENFRTLLSAIVSRSGGEVQDVEHDSTALGILSAGNISILVNDIDNGDEADLSLIRGVRERNEPAMQIPAIALTSFNRSADRIRALEAGFQTQLTKPVDPAELIATILGLLLPERRKG